MKMKSFFYRTLIFSAVWVFVFFGLAAFSITRALNEDPQVWKKALGHLGMNFSHDDSFGIVLNSDDDDELPVQDQIKNPAQSSWKLKPPEKVLKVQIPSGEVFISRGEGLDIQVQTSGHSSGGTTDQVLISKTENGELVLKTPDGSQVSNLKVKVELPSLPHVKVSIQMMSGRAVIQDIQVASLSMRSVSADMILDAVSIGRLDLKTVSGEVEIAETKAEALRVVTISGPVSVGMTDARDAHIVLKSTTGKIENAFSTQKAGSRKMKIQTTSGDIRIFQK